MKLFKYIIVVTLLFTATISQAQNAIFVTKGRIEYEKKTNLLGILKDMFRSSPEMATYKDQLLDQFNKNYKPFQVNNFNLSFDGDKTLFEPGAESPLTQTLPNWLNLPATDNRVFTDFSTQKTVSYKDVIGSKYIVNDSTKKIKWKITDETREIAGFHCRRANALLFDSIYVVAYYTAQIPVSGGPESIQGLPGMILGLAFPYEHTSWFATKVYTDVDPNKILPPAGKTKQITGNEFSTQLKSSMKDWGPVGGLLLKMSLW